MRINSKYILGTIRYLALAVLVNMPVFNVAHAVPDRCEQSWPAWESFKSQRISEDGRVIDHSTAARSTTSEGQAYALFFALIANDRATFEKLLNWTENNLVKSDLASGLPAWLWGKDNNDRWEILDHNSASDADLWMAYTIGEAGRLWTDRRYVSLSSQLANRILQDETLAIPKLGWVLLPGSKGFIPTENRVRLNPSYMPMQLMTWFATHGKDPRWKLLLNSSREIIISSSPKGYAPEWVVYDYELGFVPDDSTEESGKGSYNAIRVYLWAGMMHSDDPTRGVLIDQLMPMGRFVADHGSPPESINILTGAADSKGPSGFSAAMIPFLQTAGLEQAAEQQLALIKSRAADDNYYDQVLNLFALGWHDNIYRFDATGNLIPRWKAACP